MKRNTKLEKEFFAYIEELNTYDWQTAQEVVCRLNYLVEGIEDEE